MSTRTFKQMGQGYGSLPATITAKIGDKIVFSGEVATVNQPLPVLPDLSFQMNNTLFSWTDNTEISGTTTMEITVEGSPVLLANTVANYYFDSPAYENEFTGFYSYVVDGVYYGDPLSNEMIDGIIVSRAEDPSLTGQWFWTILPGSTFTATVNIEASRPLPSPPPTV